MICQPYVSDKQRTRSARMAAQERIDVLRGERPIVVEVGDDLLHEGLRQPDRALLVAEVIVQDGERELLRARAFVRPLEPPRGELLDVVVLAQAPPVDGDRYAV